MSHITLYQYRNELDITQLWQNTFEDNKPMNNIHVNAHPGVVNTWFFHTTDTDRVPHSMRGHAIYATIKHPVNHRVIVHKRCEMQTHVGSFQLELTPSDLQHVATGDYHMFLTATSEQGRTLPLFTSHTNDCQITVHVSDHTLTTDHVTHSVTEFTQQPKSTREDVDVMVSHVLPGNQQQPYTDPDHTMVLECQDFSGNIHVQASLLSSVPNTSVNSTDWATLLTVTVANPTNQSQVINFQSHAMWLRVITEPADITQPVSDTWTQDQPLQENPSVVKYTAHSGRVTAAHLRN